MPALAAVAQAHALACPRWCALPPDHDLESREPDGQVFRMHRAYRRCTEDVVLEVVQTATLYAHGAVAVSSPLVRLSESSSVVLTSDQTRELAAALSRTADRLDALRSPERNIVPAIALG